jgi:putative endonuclease
MFTFYILHSSIKNGYYVGHTGDAIEERLRRHNSNHKGFTGKTGERKLVYIELYNTKEDAYKRERKVKKWKSRTKLEALIRSRI